MIEKGSVAHDRAIGFCYPMRVAMIVHFVALARHREVADQRLDGRSANGLKSVGA
jgi:hypothetical protein